jgi:hypothetical protein
VAFHYFHQMQRHSLAKRQLAAIALMLDEDEKNAAVSN